MRAVLAALLLIACDAPTADSTEARSSQSASAGLSAVPASTRADRTAEASASAALAPVPSPSASADRGPETWLGVPVDASLPLVGSARYEGAEVRFTADFRTLGLGNGMSESDVGHMGFLPAPLPPGEPRPFGQTPRQALIILTTHAAVHESLLAYGASKWLGSAGGVSDMRWGPPRAVTLGPGQRSAQLLRGEGRLNRGAADLWQLRVAYPTKGGEGSATLLLGAIASGAPDGARAAFLRSFASFVPR